MEILSTINVKKTRKPHRCFGCARDIPAGSSMCKINHVDGGVISTTRWCDVCQEVWRNHMSPDDEIDMGDLKIEMPQEWESARLDIEGEAVKNDS